MGAKKQDISRHGINKILEALVGNKLFNKKESTSEGLATARRSMMSG